MDEICSPQVWQLVCMYVYCDGALFCCVLLTFQPYTHHDSRP